MYYIVESNKSFHQATLDLQSAIVNNDFGVMYIHDLANTLRNKGMDLNEECKVFEVCNSAQATKVLAIDMRLNMALPCRISVYTERGKTKICLIKPVPMLTALSQDTQLTAVAKSVEESLIKVVEQAK
jgi:uncharacterized protein (DUF302 family)